MASNGVSASGSGAVATSKKGSAVDSESELIVGMKQGEGESATMSPYGTAVVSSWVMDAREPPGAPSHGFVSCTVTDWLVVENRMRVLPLKTRPLTTSGSAQTSPVIETNSELYS